MPEGYATWAIGKWHLTPEDELPRRRPLARPVAAGPRLRALLRLLRRRDPPVRARRWSPTTTSPSSRRAYEDGYHLTEDLADHAIAYVARPALGGSRQAVLRCTSPPAPATRRTSRRPSGWSATSVASTRAGTLWREATFARQTAMGIIPEDTELSARPDWVPAWEDLERRRAAAVRPLHGVLRRLPVPRRPPGRPGASTRSPRSASSTTRSSCSCPTTAPAPRAARSAR